MFRAHVHRKLNKIDYDGLLDTYSKESEPKIGPLFQTIVKF